MNNFFKKKQAGAMLGLLLLIAFFVASSYVADGYGETIRSLVQNDNGLGMFAYAGITAFAIVLAPVSTLPLIPLAVAMWGWFAAGVLSVIGWSLGSQIAFMLAQKYGRALIRKFVSLDRLGAFENSFSKKNIFWTVVLLRLTVPVDILSYALGLFSNMTSASFFWATLIGIIPFAFIFAYLGSLPPGFQIIILIEILLFLFLFHSLRKRK